VDYTSSKKALIPSQKYSPYELGFAKMVHLEKENFVGKAALEKDHKHGVPRQLVGLEVDWTEVEARYEKFGLTPAAPSQASRVAVPVYLDEKQVGKATTATWSPVLKKMIALASIETAHSQLGNKLQIQITIEAMRQNVTVKDVKLPFFSPARKTAVPVQWRSELGAALLFQVVACVCCAAASVCLPYPIPTSSRAFSGVRP